MVYVTASIRVLYVFERAVYDANEGRILTSSILIFHSQYLTKQNLALKEVNDTRMQIYESLDISIHDLEREKHQLSVESSHSKKQIKE